MEFSLTGCAGLAPCIVNFKVVVQTVVLTALVARLAPLPTTVISSTRVHAKPVVYHARSASLTGRTVGGAFRTDFHTRGKWVHQLSGNDGVTIMYPPPRC